MSSAPSTALSLQRQPGNWQEGDCQALYLDNVAGLIWDGEVVINGSKTGHPILLLSPLSSQSTLLANSSRAFHPFLDLFLK